MGPAGFLARGRGWKRMPPTRADIRRKMSQISGNQRLAPRRRCLCTVQSGSRRGRRGFCTVQSGGRRRRGCFRAVQSADRRRRGCFCAVQLANRRRRGCFCTQQSGIRRHRGCFCAAPTGGRRRRRCLCTVQSGGATGEFPASRRGGGTGRGGSWQEVYQSRLVSMTQFRVELSTNQIGTLWGDSPTR